MKKKTLSLLLVLAMVLGSFSFAFAAEEPAAMTEAEAGEFLKKAGVLEGNDAGDLMLDKALKRQDMIVLFSRLLGQEEEAKTFDGQPTFKDIRDKYYNPYLAWGQANKLIEGHTEERFGYNEEMTAQQYVTILLRALGYGEEAKEYDNVVAKAKELGLLKDVKVENETKITRGQMSVMTMNALGTKMKDSDKTLADKLEIEMPVPEKLEVEKVYADNLKEIKVVFNKDVDVESATNADNYVTNAPAIKNITYNADENTALLLLEKTMTQKKEYKINIKGVKDDKDVLNVDKTFVAFDNAAPEVVDVVGLGTKAIKVVMSEPIENPASTNFKLDGKTLYANVSLATGREVFIRPYSTLAAGEHELTVFGLKDFAGFKSLENKYTFEVVEDKEAPTVVEAVGTTNKVVVTFSEDVDNLTVTKASVYWKSGSDKKYPSRVDRIAGNKYVFYFEGDNSLPVHETTLYIQDVADYSGNKMAAAEVAIKADLDLQRPEVISAKLGSDKKTITVKFSKAVKEDDARKKDNYRVLDAKDNKQIISKIEKVDARTYKVVLLSALKADSTYTLKISGIRDTNKYANVMEDYSEALVVADYVQPKFEFATINTDTKDGNKISTIYVYFNKSMDLATLVNPSNYLVLMNNSTKPLSDVYNEIDIDEADGSIIKITVIDEDNFVEKIGVLGVKDNSGNLLVNYGDMKGSTDTTFKLTNTTIDVDAKDTIVLTFNLPVKAAPKEAFSIDIDGVVIKSAVAEDKKVTLTVDELPANPEDKKLKIDSTKVIGFNGKALGKDVKEVTLKDKIAPSIVEVSGKPSADNKNLILTVTFDEVLKKIDKADFIVRRLEPYEEITVSDDNITLVTKDDSTTNKVEIKVPIDNAKYDSMYQVEVYGARGDDGTQDMNGNLAKDMKKSSDFIEGIAKANAVNEAKEALTLTVADDQKAQPTAKITLPAKLDGHDGVAITWAVEDGENKGKIENGIYTTPERPTEEGATSVTVTLTATLKKDGATATKAFKVTIPAGNAAITVDAVTE